MSKKASTIPSSLRNISGYSASVERQQNTIGQRILELRKDHAISLTNMRDLLVEYGVEVSAGAINKWELGETIPSSYQLVAVSKAFGIEVIDFFTQRGVASDLNELGRKKLAEYRADLIATGNYKPVCKSTSSNIIYLDMRVSNLSVSAGTGAFLDEGNFETISFPITSVPEGAEFGIRVSGDSMSPVYSDGQIVWVKQCNSLNPGEVGIFIYDGDGYIKVYDEQEPEDPEAFTDSDGVCHKQVVMVSYNQKYAPRVVSPESRFQIVGRVLN